jgi:hypothetical protein
VRGIDPADMLVTSLNESSSEVPVDGQVRIASNTKMFTAVVVLQHTSGLHSYTANMPSIFKIQHTYAEPHALLNTGLAHKPDFAPGFPAGWTYGLGLLKIKLSCGGYAYGHGGDIDGYETRTGITKDGRAATIAVTALPTTQAAADQVNKALDTALCS